jgi:hypothetical protein
MKVFNAQWGRFMDVDDKLATYMQAHGYEPVHTGGGCMGWRNDEDEGFYTMITYIDVELGDWAHIDDPQWLVGRYKTDAEGWNDGWVCYEGGGVGLERAFEIARRLPDPKVGEDGNISEKELGGRRR